MTHVKQLLAALGERLEKLARGNAVVARPVSVGNRHVVPLCELAMGVGAGGGVGEGCGDEGGKGRGKGTGGCAGGGVKACPVAVIVVEDGNVRVENLGQ